MKFKILIYTFLAPLLMLIIWAVSILIPNWGFLGHPSSPFFGGNFLGLLAASFWSNSKYLTQIRFEGKGIRLIYFTALGRKQEDLIHGSLTTVKYKKRIFLWRPQAYVKFIVAEKNRLEYYILNSETASTISEMQYTNSIPSL